MTQKRKFKRGERRLTKEGHVLVGQLVGALLAFVIAYSCLLIFNDSSRGDAVILFGVVAFFYFLVDAVMVLVIICALTLGGEAYMFVRDGYTWPWYAIINSNLGCAWLFRQDVGFQIFEEVE